MKINLTDGGGLPHSRRYEIAGNCARKAIRNPVVSIRPRVCPVPSGISAISAYANGLGQLGHELSFPYLDAAWAAKCPSHTSKLVLIALADHANSEGHCWPSVARLSRRCDMVRRTVQYALRTLEKANLITITSKCGTSSSYKLNLRIVCAPPAHVMPDTRASLAPKPSVTANKPRRFRSVARALTAPAPKNTKPPEEIERLALALRNSVL